MSEDDEEEEYGFGDAEDFGIDQETREENISRVTFDECESIRLVGEEYRDGSDIEDIGDQIGLSIDKVREYATVYRLIFQSPPEDVSVGAFTSAVDYFQESLPVDVIASERDQDVEETKLRIREFVGAIYTYNDVANEDLGAIPDEMESFEPDIEFNFPVYQIADKIQSFNNASKIFNQQLAYNARAQRELVDAINSMSYQRKLANTAIMMNSLPDIAEHLSVPSESYSEIISSLAKVGIQTSPKAAEEEPEGPEEVVDEVETDLEEDLPDDLQDLDQDEIGRFSPEEAISKSIQTVGYALSRPNARTWFVNSSERAQNSIVSVLLFTSVLALSGGNIAVATATAVILGPGLADVILNQLESN